MNCKIALMGYGYWGHKLRPYLEEQFEVVKIFGRSLESGGIYTNHLSEALADDIDAVVIATPIDTHFEVAKQALEAGKHALCEKPLTQIAAEAIKLTRLAEIKKLILMTEFTYTFSLGLAYAKTLIESFGIGKLLAMDLSLRNVGRFLKYDVYWLLASHMLSILDMFIRLDKLNFKKTDLIPGETGTIAFDGPIKGQIFVSLNYPHKEARVVFYGTEGTLKYNALDSPAISFVRYRRARGVSSNKLICGKGELISDEKNNLGNAVSRFAGAIRSEELYRENLEQSLRVTTILEELEKEKNGII